jgi:hypothetical protein
VELLTMHFSPPSCQFIPLRSKYSLNHPVSQISSICALHLTWEPKFHTHTTTIKTDYKNTLSCFISFHPRGTAFEGRRWQRETLSWEL